ncbi:hypothetical protein C3432_05375 [Citrobacter amalonaticus]|uniref:Uncharacterized protein n=1 Tax=Citrobacter amalonaticus TaxID=35703 RepID=A0A2S4RQ08_CITAM|nr:hypothetical protein C3432_05375 [Citrobacter amalonaticus]POT77071.1 hypothetical protein C3436_06445 [Citrobacter amalonaticus]POU59162.1 hypothetical protein C3430_26695 [Citrobacter amalonaticus]POV02357.1 hypothetical protein C3424_26760 [Citrobacter amalonaticus]
MGSLLISHTTCFNWYDRLANFNTLKPCFDQFVATISSLSEKIVVLLTFHPPVAPNSVSRRLSDSRKSGRTTLLHSPQLEIVITIKPDRFP